MARLVIKSGKPFYWTFNYSEKAFKMKKQNETKLFAFKLAEKKAQVIKQEPQWKVREGVALAGCSGPDARGPKANRADAGIWC
jgi:hypothetical protein